MWFRAESTGPGDFLNRICRDRTGLIESGKDARFGCMVGLGFDAGFLLHGHIDRRARINASPEKLQRTVT